MGNFLPKAKEWGIIKRCLEAGLLQDGDDYGCVPDIAHRLDVLPLHCDLVSFLRGVIIHILESRWYGAMLIGGSAFSRNLLSGKYCHKNSMSGVFAKGDAFFELCPQTHQEYVTAPMANYGAVAIVEGVITPDNYPGLEELRQRAHSAGVDMRLLSIVGLFVCEDRSGAGMDDVDAIITREDIAAYLNPSLAGNVNMPQLQSVTT